MFNASSSEQIGSDAASRRTHLAILLMLGPVDGLPHVFTDVDRAMDGGDGTASAEAASSGERVRGAVAEQLLESVVVKMSAKGSISSASGDVAVAAASDAQHQHDPVVTAITARLLEGEGDDVGVVAVAEARSSALWRTLLTAMAKSDHRGRTMVVSLVSTVARHVLLPADADALLDELKVSLNCSMV